MYNSFKYIEKDILYFQISNKREKGISNKSINEVTKKIEGRIEPNKEKESVSFL